MKVAVIGSGISGSVCAAVLAARGVAVTVFDSGRGAGGRMSQRREVMEDGKEVFFDHGAPYFTVTDPEVLALVTGWEDRGLVAEWKGKFGCFDLKTRSFNDLGEEENTKRYVGVPGMNSICKELCSGTDVSYSSNLAVLMQEIPVRSCFALMLAFSEPLISMPVKGFSFGASNIISWAFCDSSKPGRSCMSDNRECWVLHSSDEYAKHIISQTGLGKPSDDTLKRVAEDLFNEFCNVGDIPQPIFTKAHRWGSAFPSVVSPRLENCFWDRARKLAVCGDFCVSSNVEGAILSGAHAARKILETISSL